MTTSVQTSGPPQVGSTLQRLRLARGLTLEDLARIAGVSKSMLSQIEREKANPTIAITWRLANALGVPIAELLAAHSAPLPQLRVMEAHETPAMSGAHGAYTLRILGPMELAGKYEWYDLLLAPGGEMASGAHDPGTVEHLTVMSGTIEVQVGEETQRLRHGATARYAGDLAHVLRNPGKVEAKALMVVVHR